MFSLKIVIKGPSTKTIGEEIIVLVVVEGILIHSQVEMGFYV